jgi:hypothetical protein
MPQSFSSFGVYKTKLFITIPKNHAMKANREIYEASHIFNLSIGRGWRVREVHTPATLPYRKSPWYLSAGFRRIFLVSPIPKRKFGSRMFRVCSKHGTRQKICVICLVDFHKTLHFGIQYTKNRYWMHLSGSMKFYTSKANIQIGKR